jgi:hypothetical protein
MLPLVKLLASPARANTVGVMSSCTQSQSVLPGWYISVLVMVGGDPLLVRVVYGV